MDGTLAIIFVITSLTDMTLNDCPKDGCLQKGAAPSRLSLQAGQVIFQEERIDEEIYAGFDLPHRYGPFQPTIGASVAGDGGAWIGAGAKWTTERLTDSPFFIEASLMPGYYVAADSPDLGGSLQFRSALGVGYRFENGGTLSVLYDHRSNAEIESLNPGLETLTVRYAFSLQ